MGRGCDGNLYCRSGGPSQQCGRKLVHGSKRTALVKGRGTCAAGFIAGPRNGLAMAVAVATQEDPCNRLGMLQRHASRPDSLRVLEIPARIGIPAWIRRLPGERDVAGRA